MDYQYWWDEISLTLGEKDFDYLIKLLNLNRIEEARAILSPILESTEDVETLINEFKRIEERECDLVVYTKEQVTKEILNNEVSVFFIHVFGNVEKVLFLNMGTTENPKIKFLIKNEIYDLSFIKKIWKPIYKE